MYASTSVHVLDSNLCSGVGLFTVEGRTYRSFTAYRNAGHEPYSRSAIPDSATGRWMITTPCPDRSPSTPAWTFRPGCDQRPAGLPRPLDELFNRGTYEYTGEDVQAQPMAPSALRIRPLAGCGMRAPAFVRPAIHRGA